MDPDFKSKLARAKEFLFSSRHAAMATVNEDGSPHNTPFKFLFSPDLKYIYWGSHPDSLHSQNIERTGKIFVVVYDRVERGGLYLKAENAHLIEGEELKEAMEVHNSFRAKEGAEPLPMSYYSGDSPQRMYRAEVKNVWINYSKRGADGHIIKDSRREVSLEDFLS